MCDQWVNEEIQWSFIEHDDKWCMWVHLLQLYQQVEAEWEDSLYDVKWDAAQYEVSCFDFICVTAQDKCFNYASLKSLFAERSLQQNLNDHYMHDISYTNCMSLRWWSWQQCSFHFTNKSENQDERYNCFTNS